MKKYTSRISCLALAALMLLAIGYVAATAAARQITAQQAYDMMNSGQPFILLDVRNATEHAQQRIAGSILIPYDEIAQRAPAELPDQSARILIYCRSGRRSAIAANALVAMGYTNVYDFGGILDWPFATISGPTTAPTTAQPTTTRTTTTTRPTVAPTTAPTTTRAPTTQTTTAPATTTVPPTTTANMIFSTGWRSTPLNWLMFIVLFGWFWMWIIAP